MAKKQTEPVLTCIEYWQWRSAVAEMWNSNNKVKLSESESQVLKLKSEIAHMQFNLHCATRMKAAKEEALNCSLEYNKIKEALEVRLGFSLNNKMIDDVTFEVKDAPENSTSA